MNDTLPEAAEFLKELYKKKTGGERLLMASNSFNAARKLVIASLPKGLSEAELRKAIFLRFYKDDFTEVERNKILTAIEDYANRTYPVDSK